MENGKVKPKRQIYIPDTIIKKLRLMKGDKIAVSMKGGRIKLAKVKSKDNRGK
jgi:bifunctional DNA-binding transcriptional regulator/antitoxin component of YhaV-PrlF toxin-antitoxin module